MPVPTTPPSTSVPAPAFVKLNVSPETSPLSVRVLAETVTVREPVSVTAPLFWVSVFVPTNVKSAPIVTALAMPAATLASRLPPLMVSRPTAPPEPPKAWVAAPADRVPAERVVAPV